MYQRAVGHLYGVAAMAGCFHFSVPVRPTWVVAHVLNLAKFFLSVIPHDHDQQPRATFENGIPRRCPGDGQINPEEMLVVDETGPETPLIRDPTYASGYLDQLPLADLDGRFCRWEDLELKSNRLQAAMQVATTADGFSPLNRLPLEFFIRILRCTLLQDNQRPSDIWDSRLVTYYCRLFSDYAGDKGVEGHDHRVTAAMDCRLHRVSQRRRNGGHREIS